jgi:hypothetical protein
MNTELWVSGPTVPYLICSGAKCLVESLKLLVNMSNMSLRWSKSTSDVPGSSTALMRIVLGREKLVAAMGEQSGEEKELSSGDRVKRDHTEDPVSGQDLLCLVLAALCNAFLADEAFTASVADMGKWFWNCGGESD